MLAAFAIVGITLEGFHGFKTGWYLEDAYETRRLLFTLGHAHGALLALINIVFGVAVAALGGNIARLLQASRLLLMGTVLLPAGFFLGGFGLYGSDPGVGVYLVPVGALCVLAAFLIAAVSGGTPVPEAEPLKPVGGTRARSKRSKR
ncbi:MAG: hypothetical protein OXH83_06040 [Bryobacterales bacterium]|nr:hypothetical protein [Bryobacterales bacterium]